MHPLQLLLGLFVFAFVFALIQVGVVTVAFDKLGLSAGSAMLLLLTSLAGSAVNLPLFTVDAKAARDPRWQRLPQWLNSRLRQVPEGKVLIAMNVGGGLVPVCFSAYLLGQHSLPLGIVLIATGIQAAICYAASRPVPGVGIGMPVFIAPITAAITAVILLPGASAPLAYICGTLGVLVGADLLRLRDVSRLGSPVASIGGAGTFDGVFITGIVAVLLA